MVDINGKERETAKQIDVQIARTIRHVGRPDSPREDGIIAEQPVDAPRRRGARRPARIAALSGLLAGILLSAAAIAGTPVSCDAFRDVARTDAGPLRATARLARGEPLVIVAIGSSSTEGVGASAPEKRYPASVRRLLRERFPGVDIAVHNRGVGGQSAEQMLARFDNDLWPLKPHLVLWQTGTIEALRRTAPDILRRNLADGVERIRRHGAEVVLVNQQYSRSLEKRHPEYPRYVEAMGDFARAAGVPLVDRYAAMRRQFATLTEAEIMGSDGMLAPDRLHLNDDGYRCLARAIADFIACGTDFTCRDGRLMADRKGRP